jgi:5-methylcytosine-specific restriction endonuclease McrA
MQTNKDQQYNNNQWTKNRFRSFVMSALRNARWPVKYEVLKLAFVSYDINPKTGRKCKMHKCNLCFKLFMQKDMKVDHIDPVIPIEHEWNKGDNFLDYNWNEVISRLFCEMHNLQAICNQCHKEKSKKEIQERTIKRHEQNQPK